MSTPAGEPTSPNSSSSDVSRDILIDFIRRSQLGYGEWARFKALYKQQEADSGADMELLAALIARLDGVPLQAAPSAPVVMELEGANNLQQIVIHGDTLIAARRTMRQAARVGVFALSDADPLRPANLAKFETTGQTQFYFFAGDLLCAQDFGQQRPGVSLYDISDPTEPRLRGVISLLPNGLVAGDRFRLGYFVPNAGGKDATLQIYDLQNPDQPVPGGKIDIPGGSTLTMGDGVTCVVVGKLGFTWSSLPKDGGLRFVDAFNPAKPSIVGSITLGPVVKAVTAGLLVYATIAPEGQRGDAGLQIVDAADPRRPRKLGFLNLGFAPDHIAVDGNRVLAYSQGRGLYLIDATDLLAPRVIGRSPLPGVYPQSFIMRGDKIYVVSYQGVSILDISRPDHPTPIGRPPTPETFAYMKRRARRLLRGLAKRDPDRYVRLAHDVLSSTGSAELDLRRQWATIDILFGQSDRYRQTRHGRGAYVLGKTRLRLRTREERAPEAWNRRPDLAASLLQNPALPWQTHEAAWKILRDTNTPPPPLSTPMLTSLLTSPSPLLARFALREVAARIAARSAMDPSIAADAYLRAGVRLRRTIEDGLRVNPGDGAWRVAFARRMLAQIVAQLTQDVMARRSVGGAMLLATLFADTAGQLRLLDAAGAFLAARRSPLTEMVVAAARAADASDAPSWALTLSGADAAQQEAVTQALEAAIAGKSVSAPAARCLVMHENEAVRMAGWRLLAASATGLGVLQPIWTSLLASTEPNAVLRTAMSSAAALSLLERAGFGPDAVAERLAERPFLVDLLTSSTFARMTQTMPATVTLTLIAAASDAQWETLRGGWLRNLQEGIGLEELWRAAEGAIASAADDRLERRLLLDADVAHTLISSDDSSFLNIREPAFGFLLERWARGHEALFARDSALLLQAATHVLPEVRQWGLARVSALGMETPFALRLLESEVPQSVVVGKTYFDSVIPGDRQERNYALALCDSPKSSVREIGREFVLEHQKSLPMTEILRALFEHDATDMQAFVAALLTGADDASPEAVLFDQTVLRARHRGRRAKEQVKTRQSAAPTVDAPTLLALARGRAARDSEWAFAELAKRALAGETIDGFTLDGPAGG
ncbi:hypothetical protein CCAX7_23880 [Capsulimonas corticalis]|uniref:Uncharacterized protein n=1 Tax=Capsulimonas corticalis TaxID=2219043 RepID=A0A402CVB0_9BACT|nr:hypothetical protein [Capsulimonas corticalis]BDI30337.1 hypothetical protein CCAX7_23880 [Capsulimonas corticalis]